MNNKTTTNNRSDATSTPLATKVMAASGRLESFEEEREMELDPGLHTFNDHNGTRLNIAETKVITGVPNKILTDIKDVDKNIWDDAKFIGIKTK